MLPDPHPRPLLHKGEGRTIGVAAPQAHTLFLEGGLPGW